MKNFNKILVILLVFAMVAGCLTACNTGDTDTETPTTEAPTTEAPTTEAPTEDPTEEPTKDPAEEGTTGEPEFVDYASQVKFDKNSGKVWAEVKVHEEKNGDRTTYGFVDGDTTHFDVPASVASVIGDSVLKARYLGINTPESTGVIEPWGKKASNYTKDALKDATSIIIESDTPTWDADSTGGRYLVWVWYKTAEMTDYRNLNIEILQQGLAYGSNTGGNTYGEIASAALAQAKTLGLHVFSKDKDPDFYYGGAYEVSLKELKTNTEKYKDKLVKFEGVVTMRSNVTIYMEEYDAENNMYFGIQVFCGYGVPGSIMKALSVGNRVCMVGTLQYYENGGYFQVSNIQFDIMQPNSPEYVHKISDGHSASFIEVDANTILNGTVDIERTVEDEEGNETTEIKTFKYGELAQHSTVTVSGLTVVRTWTTQDGDSKGAISLYCQAQDGTEITVRTEVLYDENKNLVTEDIFRGKTIDASGIIDFYKGAYQVKVFSIEDITIH